jgi:hypothetical protein
MHRIDAPGATGANLFTEGNPALGIPATEVSDDWLNDVQEELCNLIENQGITLVKGNQNQLENAIFGMIGGGGTNIKIDPLLNNTADQIITGLVFDKTSYKGAVFFVDVHRETDSSNVQETFLVAVNYDPKDDVWRLSMLISGLDDTGVTFNVTSTGQVRASTDTLAGTNYDAQLRVTGIVRFTL